MNKTAELEQKWDDDLNRLLRAAQTIQPWGIFLIVVLVAAVCAGLAYLVYRRYKSGRGFCGRFKRVGGYVRIPTAPPLSGSEEEIFLGSPTRALGVSTVSMVGVQYLGHLKQV